MAINHIYEPLKCTIKMHSRFILSHLFGLDFFIVSYIFFSTFEIRHVLESVGYTTS